MLLNYNTREKTLHYITLLFFVGNIVLEGKIQIMQPKLNSYTLTADDLVNKKSENYIFLTSICTEIVSIKGYYFVCNS